MALQRELIGAGAPALLTQGILGSVANSLTAAGSTNADALQLTAAINRVTTTALNTGVVLPISLISPGARVTVVNSGANALTVYPGTGAQINALTVTTGGFSVVAGGRADFIAVTDTNWFAILSDYLGSVANNLTAAGSTNADALQLTAAISRVTTTALNTGVVLPISLISPGVRVTVVNSGADALTVYPGTGAQINALTVTTGGFSVAAGGRADFIAVTDTNWFAILSA